MSPPTLARFLSKQERDHSVVLLDVETFCTDNDPSFFFNVILNSIRVRGGAVRRFDLHFATMGVELTVVPSNAEIVDYTQSSKLSIEYQKEISQSLKEAVNSSGKLTLSDGKNSGETTVALESGSENIVKGSAAFVSTENELVAVFRTADLQWRLDPMNVDKVVRQFQQGNLWLNCAMEAKSPDWSVEVSVKPTELRAYSADLLEPLSETHTIWMLMKMWMKGIKVRNKDGETFTLTRRVAV